VGKGKEYKKSCGKKAAELNMISKSGKQPVYRAKTRKTPGNGHHGRGEKRESCRLFFPRNTFELRIVILAET